MIFFYETKTKNAEENNKVVVNTYDFRLAFYDVGRKALDVGNDLLIVYVPIGEIMPPHLKPGASQGTIIYESEQQFLSQWLKDEPAFKEVFSKLPETDKSLSPSQIDAILSIRRKITEAKHSHD